MVKSPRTLESACLLKPFCQRSLISSTDRSEKTARKSGDATTTTIYMTTDKPPARRERQIYDYERLLCTEIPAPEGRVGQLTMEQGWVPAVTHIILQN